MKKLILTAFAVSCAASVFAQGTVTFNNRVTGALVSYVYYNSAVSTQIRGNGTAELPAGTVDWTGFTRIAGSTTSTPYMAAILAGTGSGLAESSLSFGATPQTTTFRTGSGAGNVASITATVGSVAPDAPQGTFSIFAWNTSMIGGGTVLDAVTAYADWQSGKVIGGTSGAFTVNSIGGSVNTPPNLLGWVSFNIYAVPEPSTMALAGLAAASLLIFRRRK